MPTIITSYEARVAPSQPNAPNIHLDTSMGDNLQRVGAAISSLSSTFDRKAQLAKQREAQNAQIGLMSLNENAGQALIETQRNAPANGEGIGATFNEKFLIPETTKFLGTINDPEVKQEYAKRLELFRLQHEHAAANTEYNQGNQFSVGVVNTHADEAKRGIAETPTMLKTFVDDFNASVDSQPLLTQPQRDEAKQKFAQAAPAIMAEALAVKDPETLGYMLGLGTKEERVKFLMPHLSKAVYGAETSGGANNVTSPKGATGAMQVMPDTAIEIATKLGDTEFLDASPSRQKAMLKSDYYSFRYGNEYLRQGLDKYNGDIELALIRYNAGEGRVKDFLAAGRDWSKMGKWANETHPYTEKILADMGTHALAGQPLSKIVGDHELTGVKLPAKFVSIDGRQPVHAEGTNPKVIDKWEHVQGSFGRTVNIVSATRDAATNEAAHGAKGSEHLHGNAIDLDVSGMGKDDRIRLLKLASSAGFTGIGVYQNSIHLDIGARRAWGPTHHGDSVPEWARGVIADHMKGGYGGPVDSSAPALSSGDAGSGGMGEAAHGVTPPPAPRFTGEVAPEFQGMTGAALLQLRSQALSAMKGNSAADTQAKADAKAELLDVATNDTASLLATGQGTVKPEDMRDFETNLLRNGGRDDVIKWQNDRIVNSAIYAATKDMGKMDASNIGALVKMMEPTGGDNASLQARVLAGVTERANKELDSRKDPGVYVQSDPTVKDAMASIDPKDVTTTEYYFSTVKDAQRRIGLPFTPLATEDAKKASAYIANTFIDAELTGHSPQDASTQILKTFEAMYGGYADDVYVQALGETMDARISKDTKDVLGQTFIDWIKANPSVSNPMNSLRSKKSYFEELGAIEKALPPPEQPQSWLEYLGGKAYSMSPAGVAGEAAKQVGDIWQTLGAPAMKLLPDPFNDVSVAMPQITTIAPKPNVIPGLSDPGNKAPPPFRMPGVKDYDLNALSSNAGDPAVQDRFRFEYGEDVFKQTMDEMKKRQMIPGAK